MCSRFEHFFKSLIEIKLVCNRYFTSTSNKNDCSFFSKKALKCTSEVNKVHKNKLRKEKAFFSLVSLCNRSFYFSKNSKDTCYFSRKKSFMRCSAETAEINLMVFPIHIVLRSGAEIRDLGNRASRPSNTNTSKISQKI